MLRGPNVMLSAFLEREAPDQLSAPRRTQLCPVSEIAKGAEAGNISPADGVKVAGPARTALIGRSEGTDGSQPTVYSESCGIRKLNAIKHVLELDSNLERVPFFDPEVPLEVHRFGRLPLSAEERVGGGIRRPRGIGDDLPCVRIDRDGLCRIEAVAVDIQRIGAMSTTVVGPVHRPWVHQAAVGVPLQLRAVLRRGASTAPEPAADGVHRTGLGTTEIRARLVVHSTGDRPV